MNILQIANVPTRLGGTGACAYDVMQALPDEQHRILFTRPVNANSDNHFECETAGPDIQIEWRAWADIVLCHNVSLKYVRAGDVYYSHSRKDLRFSKTIPLLDLWCVSKWLAARCNISPKVVLQPVSPPPSGVRRSNVVLRICTPKSSKWRSDDLLDHYKAISASLSSVSFMFVGCPRNLKPTLVKACSPHTTIFHEASLDSRRLYSQASILFYTSSQTETYGRTICEAQQAGCIPIVSNHSGLAEQVTQGFDGFQVQSEEDSVQAVINSLKSFEYMSKRASENGHRRGSLSRWRTTFMNLVNEGSRQ